MLLGIITHLQALYGDKKAVTAVEYGLLIALIAGVLAATLSTFETSLAAAFTGITF